MDQEKIYAGNGKEVQPDGWDQPMLKFDIDLSVIKAKGMEHIREVTFRDGTKHQILRMMAVPLRQPDDHRTHSIQVDTFDYEKWKRQKEDERALQGAPSSNTEPSEPTNDLPF